MSRLASVNITSIPPPASKMTKRQSSLDVRRKDAPPPLSSTRLSRYSVSSNDDMDSPSSRFSTCSFGSIQTNITSCSSIVTKRLSVKPTQGTSALYNGERVVVDSMNIVGTLRYLGDINNKPGVWAGIELDILGTGKNDGSVQGVQYFKCPPETGIFVMASKVAPLDCDGVFISPPTSPYLATSQQQQSIGGRVTRGSKAEQHTASPWSQRSATKKRLSNASSISTTTSGSHYGARQLTQSPISTRISRASSSSSSSIQPQQKPSTQQHDDMDDDYTQDDSVVISDEHMLTDTPVPVNLATSESTDIPITQQDEATLQEQLHLRLQVLEAENKYLKLENTQNKAAEHIHSTVLRKEDGDQDDYFTLEKHKAIVDEIKQDHDIKKKVWETDLATMRSSIKKLENRIFELETEQSELVKERDELLTCLGDTRKAKDQMEQKVHELEQKVDETTCRMVPKTTANFYSQDPDEMQERQRQMEMEMDEVHDKMASLLDAMRAKDMFLGTLSDQVEHYRNLVEEKERECRRVRLDSDRYYREKERLRDEIKDLEAKWVEGCVTKEEFDQVRRDAKEQLVKEIAAADEVKKRMLALEQTVDELKAAGMESIELYENSVELHRVAMETVEANLNDEQCKVAALALEKAQLIKTGAEALDTFEHDLAELKHQQAIKIQGFENTIDQLKQEISRLVEASGTVGKNHRGD
ncbi:hypothetical protein BC941DRAFT_513180 [Chlamydoabsidia padenii]|nr:hypothetical protein BC941DRAFT_513180 [Chlamydoabsidia padenii]